MQEVKLSKRLLMIANFVPYNKKVADIGSDHALLPCYLLQNNIANSAIAGEVNEGPFLTAKKQITNLNLEAKISVRKGNGLEILQVGEVDVIIIAGMGGALIVEILEKGRDKLINTERLILQPNVGEELVRKWLDNNLWNVTSEEIIKEDGKIYEIIVAQPRKEKEDPVYNIQKNKIFPKSKEELYRVGPILYKKNSDVLIEKWKNELQKVNYIKSELNKSNDKEKKAIKEQELLMEVKWIEEVIKCLQMDKI